jgi:hypothetical protein
MTKDNGPKSKDVDQIAAQVRSAISSGDPDQLEEKIELMWHSDNRNAFLDLWNELLIDPNHTQHQSIAKYLQDKVKSPSTIPYVERALASRFDYLAYKCSESGVIAKWFSWLLFEIGTPEAISVMRRYADDPDEGIRNEMRYRLAKL